MCWLHRGRARLPLRRADLAVLVGILEGLDEPQELVNVAADLVVRHLHIAEFTLTVDDVSCAVGNALLLAQAAKVLGDHRRPVSDHRDLDWCDATFIAWLLSILLVRVVRVSRARNNLAVVLRKLICLVRELAYLCGTHKGEISRVEK